MWKWLAWAGRIAATALLLSFLSIWTTGYIVNSYVETLLKQLNLPMETQPFALSGVWGKLWGATPVPEEQADEDRDQAGLPNRGKQPDESGAKAPSASPESRNREGTSIGGTSGRSSEGASAGEGLGGDGRNDNGGSSTGDGSGASIDGADAGADEHDRAQTPAEGDAEGSAAGGPDGAVPVFGGQEDAAALSAERRQALSAIMSKLNGEQLGALTGYLEDGLTPDELVSVQELLKPSLTESEYAQMMEALAPTRAKADDSIGNP